MKILKPTQNQIREQYWNDWAIKATDPAYTDFLVESAFVDLLKYDNFEDLYNKSNFARNRPITLGKRSTYPNPYLSRSSSKRSKISGLGL